MSITTLKLKSQLSTGVACAKTNRNFIGIELDRDYYDIAVNRINEAKETANGDISQE